MAPQKRYVEESESLLAGVKVVVMDIEGTLTPISFVKDTLHSYITKNLDTYLNGHFDSAETQKDIAALRSLAAKDKEDDVDGPVAIPDGEDAKDEVIKAVTANIKWMMDTKRKTAEMNQFFAHMWSEGYKLGTIKTELFDDVITVLNQLFEEEFKLYLYSAGSVEAQKLMFANSSDGDMTDIFSGYFDLTTGSKTDTASYKTITKEIGCLAEEILFITDSVEEAKASKQVGHQCAIIKRPGNEDLSEETLHNNVTIKDFHELFGGFNDPDLKRFEGDNGEADDDDDEPEDEEDDEECDDEIPDDENPDEEDDA